LARELPRREGRRDGANREGHLKEKYTIMATKNAVKGKKSGAKLTKKGQPPVKNLAAKRAL